MTAVFCLLTGRIRCCISDLQLLAIWEWRAKEFLWLDLASRPSLGCATADLWETAERKRNSKVFKYQA